MILINAVRNSLPPDFHKPAHGALSPSEFGDGEMPDDNAERSSCPSPQRQPGSTARITDDRSDLAGRYRLVLFPVSLAVSAGWRPLLFAVTNAQRRPELLYFAGQETISQRDSRAKEKAPSRIDRGRVDLWREETGQGCDLEARKAQPRPVGLTCPR